MTIIALSIVYTAVVFGGSIGVAVLISNGIDKIIGTRANKFYNKYCKSLEE